MKRLLAIFVAIVWTAAAIASNGYEVKYDRLSDGVQQLNFTIGDYSVAPVNLDGSTFSKLNFEGKVVTMKKGFAELPYVHAVITSYSIHYTKLYEDLRIWSVPDSVLLKIREQNNPVPDFRSGS